MPPRLPTEKGRNDIRTIRSAKAGSAGPVLLQDPYLTSNVSIANSSAISDAVAGVAVDLKSKKEDRAAAKGKFALASAKVSFLEQRLAIEDEINNDANYEGHVALYEKKIQKALTDTQGTFRVDQRYLPDFQLAAREEIAFGRSRVKAGVDTKRRDVGATQYGIDMQKLKERIASTKDPAQRAELFKTASQATDGAYANMFIDQPTALVNKKNFPRDVALLTAENSPPDEILAELDPKMEVDVYPHMSEAAKNKGLPDDYLPRVARIESDGNTQAINDATQATGLFQFKPSVADAYGIDPTDPVQSITAAAELADNNRRGLRSSIKREPTAQEIYLAHQQGATGAAALLNNPDTNAVDVLEGVYGNRGTALKAVTLNGGAVEDTAQEFANRHFKKYSDAKPVTHIADIQYGPKKGSIYDFLSVGERNALARGALEAQALTRAESDPVRFLSGYDDGQYDMMGVKKKREIRAIAEQELERSIQAPIVGKIRNEIKYDAFIYNPNIPSAQKYRLLADLNSRGEVREEWVTKARAVAAGFSNDKTPPTETEKHNNLGDLSRELSQLYITFGGTASGFDADKDVVLNRERMAAYNSLKSSVSSAVQNGFMTGPQASSFIENVERNVVQTIEDKSFESEGRTDEGFFGNKIDPYSDTLSAVDIYADSLGMNDEQRSRYRYDVFTNISNFFGEYDAKGDYKITGEFKTTDNAAQDKKNIIGAVEAATKQLNINNYAGRVDPQNPPNSYVSAQPTALSRYVPPEMFFNSLEDMEKANLPPGTRVVVNGRLGTFYEDDE